MSDDKKELPKNNKDDSVSIARKSSLQELYQSSESTMASLAQKTNTRNNTAENNNSSAYQFIPSIPLRGIYKRATKTDTPPKIRNSKRIRRGIAIGTLALGVGITGTGIYIYNTNARIHYKLGNRYYEERKYDNAIASYSKAIAIDISYFDSYLNLGKVYNDVGNYDLAIITLNKALQITPDNVPVFLERGKAYFYLGSHQRALDCYFNVLVYEPENELALLGRGKTYLYMNETDNAADDLNKVTELNKDNAEAFAFQGFLFDKIGKRELSLKAFEKANSIDPDISVMFYKIAELYRTQNKPDEAFDYYTKTMLLDNQNANAFYHCGVIYGDRKEYPLSLQDFSSALLLDFSLAVSILEYGETLIPGYSDDALSIFLEVSAYCIENKILEISLYEPMLHYAIKYSEYSLYDKDMFVCTEMLKIYPESADVFVNRGFANLMLHNTEDAIADYSNALDIESKNETALIERGVCYLINNQYYEARADFSKELGINANNKDIYEYRAILFDLHNESELAELDYSKASKTTEFSVVSHNEKISKTVTGYINKIIAETFYTKDFALAAQYYSVAKKYSVNEPAPDLMNDIISKDYTKNASIYLYQALLLDFTKDYQIAIENYEKAVTADKNVVDRRIVEAYLLRAFSNDLSKNYQNAIIDYEKAQKIDKTIKDTRIAQAYLNRATSYNMSRNFQRAIEDFEKAISIAPGISNITIAQAYLGRAFSYNPETRYHEAIRDIELARSLDRSISNTNIGIYYFNRAINRTNYSDVIDDYTTAIRYNRSLQSRKSANVASAYYQQALYYRGSSKDAAKASVRTAISIYPGYYKAADDLLEDLNKGCFITTATLSVLNKPDDCYELTMFRNFRDNWLIHEPDGKSIIHEYYRIAPAIVKEINNEKDKTNIYKSIWNDYLNPCLVLLEKGNFIECKKTYTAMVMDLSNIYAYET
jgi:tetratricopeptide (TPR) repeat protein